MALKLRDLEWPLIGKYARGPYGLKNFKQKKKKSFPLTHLPRSRP